MKTYKVRFLVSTTSWSQVKRIFSDDLGIVKDKKDGSAIPIRDHYIVEVELEEKHFNDEFYEKVKSSNHITILEDSYSLGKSSEILKLVAPVELKLRELCIYAYDLASTYKQIIRTKQKDAKQLIESNQLVGQEVKDPSIAFLDFGELIDFFGKTGNEVDETNLADDTARLMEQSASFSDFKQKFVKKFKRFTVWEIISRAVLAKQTDWEIIKQDLVALKEVRNTALHHRALMPSQITAAQEITTRLMDNLVTKKPEQANIKALDTLFDSWNSVLRNYGSYQGLSTTNRMLVDALRGVDTTKTLQQKILENSIALHQLKMPTITSPANSLLEALNAVNRHGLTSWVTDEDKDQPLENDTRENEANSNTGGDAGPDSKDSKGGKK